jgi:putative oxidoreductase
MVAISIGFLVARLIVGLAIASHGAQKLFGMFGGQGLAATGAGFESMGYRPGKLFALAASLGEIGGGLLTVFGLGGPLGPALMILVMIVAVFTVHFKNGFFTANGGYELNAIYVATALALAFSGFGIYSLDHAFGLERFYTPAVIWIVIAVGIVFALLNLIARRPMTLSEGESNPS